MTTIKTIKPKAKKKKVNKKQNPKQLQSALSSMHNRDISNIPTRNIINITAWAPAMYNDPEEIAHKINDYFNFGCRVQKKDWIEIPTPTITWLALYLGFASRQSLYDYWKKEKFAYIIKKATTFIEMWYEEMLRTNPTWAIFALKNMWWTDKMETVNHTTFSLKQLHEQVNAIHNGNIIEWEVLTV